MSDQIQTGWEPTRFLDSYDGPVWRYNSPLRPITQLPLIRIAVVIDPATIGQDSRILITARPLTPAEIQAYELTLLSEPVASEPERYYVIATFNSQEALDNGDESLYMVADSCDASAPSWTSDARRATRYTCAQVKAEIARLRAIPGFWTEHAFQYRPAA